MLKTENQIDISMKEILRNIENNLRISSNIDLKTFMNKATYE